MDTTNTSLLERLKLPLGISENAVHLAKGRVLRRLRKELEGLIE
jgi:hypothetical protein